MTGAASAKLVGFAATPLLTRLYSPSDFGALSVFTALLALLLPLSTFRYVIALPLPKKDRRAINLLALCVALSLILSAILALIISMWGEKALQLLASDALLPYAWCIPLALLGASIFEIANVWAVRKRDFSAVSRSQIQQALSGSAVKLLMGVAGFQPLGLLLGQIVQQSAGAGYLLRRFLKDLSHEVRSIRIRRMRALARRYASFPLYRLPSQLLLATSAQAPVLFVSARYDIAVAGQFGLAMTALSLPVTLISRTAGQAYFGEIASIGVKDPKRIFRISTHVIIRMMIVALLPALVILIFGPQMFELVFGENWRAAGSFARMLSPHLVFLFVSQPLVQVLTVFEKNGWFLGINVLRTAIVGLIIMISTSAMISIGTFVIFYSAALCIFYAVVSGAVMRFLWLRAAAVSPV